MPTAARSRTGTRTRCWRKTASEKFHTIFVSAEITSFFFFFNEKLKFLRNCRLSSYKKKKNYTTQLFFFISLSPLSIEIFKQLENLWGILSIFLGFAFAPTRRGQVHVGGWVSYQTSFCSCLICRKFLFQAKNLFCLFNLHLPLTWRHLLDVNVILSDLFSDFIQPD